MNKDKVLGGLYGALVGDACGCPYEFRPPSKIPPFEQIEMIPPADYNRAWKAIPVGTYTDDGAQALMLLEVLLSGAQGYDMQVKLRTKLLAWLGGGYMSVDNVTFDVGAQTKHALIYCDGIDQVQEQLSDDRSSGNGSLMRCISVALVAFSLTEAVRTGADQSYVTHPSHNCILTCAFYAGIAYEMLQGTELNEALEKSKGTTRNQLPNLASKFKWILDYEYNEPTGTGFVVDSFWSAIWALHVGKTYEEVIKYAISLGNDTDTTACIAGGLAGIKFGYEGIPAKWLQLLRGTELISPLAARLGSNS